jgi:hypothetical protein
MTADLRTLAEAMPEQFRDCDWRWQGYVKGPLYLATAEHGRLYIMGFKRQGMDGAQPMFAHTPEGAKYHRMELGSKLAVREVDYRDDITGFDNPFATWMAAASPQAVLALYDEIDRLKEGLRVMQENFPGGSAS